MTNMTIWMLGLSGLLAADALLLWLGYQWSVRGRAPASRLDRQRLNADFDVLRSAMEGLDDCLATVDDAMQRVAPIMRERTSDDMDKSKVYSIAHRLAGKGASVDELMNDCGLSRGEAQLVRNLHEPS